MIEARPQPEPGWLREHGVFDWPVREKAVSRFDWTCAGREQCYLLEGEVTVTPAGGSPVRFGAGDFVTLPAGLSCVRDISVTVRKHYRFG